MAKRKLQTLSLQDNAKLIREVDKGVGKKKDIAAAFGVPPNTLSTNCEDLWNHETKCQVLCFSIFAVSNPMLRMKMNFTVGKVQLRTFSCGSKLTRLVKYSTVKINVGFSPFPITRILD